MVFVFPQNHIFKCTIHEAGTSPACLDPFIVRGTWYSPATSPYNVEQSCVLLSQIAAQPFRESCRTWLLCKCDLLIYALPDSLICLPSFQAVCLNQNSNTPK